MALRWSVSLDTPQNPDYSLEFRQDREQGDRLTSKDYRMVTGNCCRTDLSER
jgi:hypothetical protein